MAPGCGRPIRPMNPIAPSAQSAGQVQIAPHTPQALNIARGLPPVNSVLNLSDESRQQIRQVCQIIQHVAIGVSGDEIQAPTGSVGGVQQNEGDAHHQG
mgnify:CR=1 FL=1